MQCRAAVIALHLLRWLLESGPKHQTRCCTQEKPHLSSMQHLQGISTPVGGLGLLQISSW